MFFLRKIPVFFLLFASICCAGQQKKGGHSSKVKRLIRHNKLDSAKVNPYCFDSLLKPIPFNRAYIHDKIDRELLKADLSDGIEDAAIKFFSDTSLSVELSNSILKNVRRLKILIENMPARAKRDSVAENQEKIRCLTAIWELLRKFNNDTKPEAGYYIHLVGNISNMIIASNEDTLMEFAIANKNIYTLDNAKVLLENHHDVRSFIYFYMGMSAPQMMIRRLPEYAADSFSSKIIALEAKLEPEVIFNYASSSNPIIKKAIFNTKDSLVKSIVAIVKYSLSPLKALSFLSEIYFGQKAIQAIDSIASDNEIYLKNLVRLKIQNDSIALNFYSKELSYRSLIYVRKMNELHEEKDGVRFKCVDSLSAFELYYLIVNSGDEIYTSTYLGLFKRLTERLKPMNGNQLLDSVRYDKFRTFFRLAANYNTLSRFMETVTDSARNEVLNKFISGLQLGNEDDLEGAVDVADAFGSIKDSALAEFLTSKIKENYTLANNSNIKKGVVIYRLLARLVVGNKYLNSDTGSVIASQRLNLPSLNIVPYGELANDSGVVFEQAFFFGDEDGINSYKSFLSQFSDTSRWIVDTTQYWIKITSLPKKYLIIYANRPLTAPDDEIAQNKLCQFLEDNKIHPTVIIHRGHSYHLPMTITKLNNYAKIIVLGSCGGYHNLKAVLEHSPDANIVSSKQTGSMDINDPIITAINKTFLAYRDVNWIAIWNELESYFESKPELKEKFSDYVPPHHNMGAIFIRSYKRMIKE